MIRFPKKNSLSRILGGKSVPRWLKERITTVRNRTGDKNRAVTINTYPLLEKIGQHGLGDQRVHFLGFLFFGCRLAHAYGVIYMEGMGPKNIGRMVGALGSWGLMGLAALLCIRELGSFHHLLNRTRNCNGVYLLKLIAALSKFWFILGSLNLQRRSLSLIVVMNQIKKHHDYSPSFK